MENFALSEPASDNDASRFQAVQTTQRKLIKTGQLDFETSNVKDSKVAIEKIVNDLNAYSSDEVETVMEERILFTQTIRVPISSFDGMVKKIEALAFKVDSKSINVQDVSEEFVDQEARLRTKKDVEARYREILKQAKSVQEILSVETELGNVRSEIESIEGRLKYLSDQTTMSTLNLSYYQTKGADFGFGSKIISALKGGWKIFLVFIVGTIYLWPFIIIIGILWFFRRWWKSKKAA